MKEKEADLKAAEQRLIEEQERTREQHAEEKKALEKQRLVLVCYLGVFSYANWHIKKPFIGG